MRKLFKVIMISSLGLSLLACGAKKEIKETKQTNQIEKQTLADEDLKKDDDVDKSEVEKEGKKDKAATLTQEFDKDGKLTVGFDKDFPPMGFVGADGKFTGFDLELAQEAAKRMGLEIAYQPIAWDAKDMELNSGTIDLIWNGFTITGREDSYLWSEPYMENAQVFVVRKDSKIKEFEDLKKKVVEVQVDSSAEAALKTMPELTAIFKELKTAPDYNTGFMDLESGAIDALAMDEVVAAYQLITRKNNDFIILDKKLAAEQYAIAFAKTNKPLRDKLQGVMDAMQDDGTISKISNKWFGRDVSIPNK